MTKYLYQKDMGKMAGRKIKNLVGEKFGTLTVVRRDKDSPRKQAKWLCSCECGKSVVVYGLHLKRGATKSCGCQRFQAGSKHRQWTGHGEISGQRWNAYLKDQNRRGCRKNIPFDITIEYAWELFLKQDRKCALSGIPLVFARVGSDWKNNTASLDRIDNKKGYVVGNVQWLHKDINKMKNIHSQEYFVSLCKSIAAHV